jgi:ribonuclease HII
MAEYHRLYPHYNFLSHKGYSTEEHLQQLATHGPCPIHRRTFEPVAQTVAQLRDPKPAVSPPRESRRTIA